MKNLYKTIMETTTICCLGIASFLVYHTIYYFKNINYDLENSRKLVREFRAEWDSSSKNLNKNLTNLGVKIDKLVEDSLSKNLNKNLTNLETNLDKIEANQDKFHKDIIYLTGFVDGASIIIH